MICESSVFFLFNSLGVTYIKYAKTSQAAKALEAMNGRFIGNANRNIKVMVAAR